jgi:hypothetical protein
VRSVSVVRNEPRADGDVAGACLDTLEKPPELVRRVLPVRVDAPAVRVIAVARVCVSGRDRRAQAAVFAERQHFGAS